VPPEFDYVVADAAYGITDKTLTAEIAEKGREGRREKTGFSRLAHTPNFSLYALGETPVCR
jgi:hypothetical protein